MKVLIGFGILLAALTRPLCGQSSDSLAVHTQELAARLRFLSSDVFEGRYPGTRGEELTTSYLVSELEAFGLRPGAPRARGDTAASWLQPVSFLVHQPDSSAPVEARLSGRINRALEPGREIRFSNFGEGPDVRASGELVFVGYGINAPMYRWNDFAGSDLRGKIAIALQGEPTVAGDTARFNGVRASRYSWVFDKLAEVERRGAVGLLLVVPSGPAQSPVRSSRHLAADVRDARLTFMGSITDSTLAGLLPPGSPPLGRVLESASRGGFRAMPLGVRLDTRFRTRSTRLTSHNVIGVVPGTDRRLASEHVVLSAHWDAYGIGPAVQGDSIYNGALDDGSGMTALLALARVFAAHPQRRSLTFLFTTAEEWGLFGAHAFVCSGPVPMERVVANLNLDDGIELLGPKRDAAPLGVELSTLGETVRQVSAKMRLKVSPDPYPQEGFFLRADNYPFARAGVPSLYMGLGTDAVGSSREYVDSMVKDYLERHYHKPSDEYETVAIDLEGSRQFAEFVRDVAIAVANDDRKPSWLPGAEFQRDQDRRAANNCVR